MFIFTPVAGLDLHVIDLLWAGLSTGLLAWGLTRDRLWSPRLLTLISPAFLYALQVSQWSPLLLAVTLLPVGRFLYLCKPTAALWLFAYRPSWRTVAECAAMLVLVTVAWPGGALASVHAMQAATWTLAPVTIAGGPLLLLVLLRWRRPEARMLATMALVPHATLIYETVPLCLIPETWTEAAILWCGMLAARLGRMYLGAHASSQLDFTSANAVWLLWLVYLPCLVMILRRPNVAEG